MLAFAAAAITWIQFSAVVSLATEPPMAMAKLQSHDVPVKSPAEAQAYSLAKANVEMSAAR